MPWAKMDDQLLDNEIVMEVSNDAFAVWTCCFIFCARNLTDGFVSKNQARSIAGGRLCGPEVIQELAVCGLFEETDGGYIVRFYREWNPTSEEYENKKKVRAESGRLGGLRSAEARRARAKANAPARAEANASPIAEPNGEANGQANGEAKLKQNRTSSPEPPSGPPLTEKYDLAPGAASEAFASPIAEPNGEANTQAKSNPVPVPVITTDITKVISVAPDGATKTDAATSEKSEDRQMWTEFIAAGLAEPMTRSERGKWNRAIADLREAGVQPKHVRWLVKRYRERFPDVDCTPTGIAANLGLLRSPPPGQKSVLGPSNGKTNGYEPHYLSDDEARKKQEEDDAWTQRYLRSDS